MAAAGLGSGLEGFHPLLRARGTGGGRADGCGRRTACHCFSCMLLAGSGEGESPASSDGLGDLLKGLIIPGTEMLNVNGKGMMVVNAVRVYNRRGRGS